VTAIPSHVAGLPPTWTVRSPVGEDVAALTALTTVVRRAAHDGAEVDGAAIEAIVVGPGSWTRRQLVVTDGDDRLRAWLTVHDRAAGRTMVDLVVEPGLPEGDAIAPGLLGWAAAAAREMAVLRQLESTQLDASPYADQTRLQRWLTDAGYRKQRTWLHMTRPVDAAETLPPPREGVHLRRVRMHDDGHGGEGMPVAKDIQLVHQMLEESFADHFNSYRESFPEFLQRLREDPGHRWDHWWIAEIDTDEDRLPGGALVSSRLTPDASGRPGSYVDYIGVHRRARGRGVAKALLHAVMRDAQERGRSRVDLEVDADSPTGADGIYWSMGWALDYVTESWHADCPVD
jgi:mycothiol synthase